MSGHVTRAEVTYHTESMLSDMVSLLLAWLSLLLSWLSLLERTYAEADHLLDLKILQASLAHQVRTPLHGSVELRTSADVLANVVAEVSQRSISIVVRHSCEKKIAPVRILSASDLYCAASGPATAGVGVGGATSCATAPCPTKKETPAILCTSGRSERFRQRRTLRRHQRCTAFGNDHVILQADPKLISQINPWFVGEGHSSL